MIYYCIQCLSKLVYKTNLRQISAIMFDNLSEFPEGCSFNLLPKAVE